MLDDIIFKVQRVVVPTMMRSQMLKKIHSSHIGTGGCLRRAREALYWPGMNTAIRENASACEACNTHRTEQSKQSLIPQRVPDRPWSKVAIDLFTLGRKDYIIIVDDYSNFFEFNVITQTTSAAIVTSMKSEFARHGIPEEVRSDNGPQVTSTDFQDFAKEWEFKHVTSSPHYAQSNGKVKNAVKTTKSILNKAQADNLYPYLALLDWRNTPTEGLYSAPVQRLMGRRTRTLLPTSEKLLKPKLPSHVKESLTKKRMNEAHYYNRVAKPLPELKQGDVVRNMTEPNNPQNTWRKRICNKRVGARSYEVECEGKVYRRNRKHLAASTEKADEETKLTDEPAESCPDCYDNSLPARDELKNGDPPQELSSTSTQVAREPFTNLPHLSGTIERRSSFGRLIKAPDYFY